MQPKELLDELRQSGADIHVVEGGYIEVFGKLTDEQRAAIKAFKPDLLRLLSREQRLNQVRKMMVEDDQPRTYYLWPDTESNPDYVIVACAKRGVAEWEMTIEREKWDAMKFLDLVASIQ